MIGALGVGAYAYYDTGQVARTAMTLFACGGGMLLRVHRDRLREAQDLVTASIIIPREWEADFRKLSV